MRKQTVKRKAKRTGVGIVGGIVLLVGLITVPYPGPGWLTVFVGLGILSTEFEWAKRLLRYGRDKYDRWIAWVARQAWWVRTLITCLVGLVVVITIWLLNGYGLIADFFQLDYQWLQSPFLW